MRLGAYNFANRNAFEVSEQKIVPCFGVWVGVGLNYCSEMVLLTVIYQLDGFNR